MSWTKLQAEKRVAPEPTSRAEIDELREVVERNLNDAALPGLSADGKFAMAYNAARTLANIAVRASGYRVKHAGGGHYNTFLAMEQALGPAYATLSAYFDACRIKRNDLSYDAANVVTDAEANHLLNETTTFCGTVDRRRRD